ncbi:MAG: phospholipase D-like domain-containing protein, partial [Methanococcaceae archaeon]
VSWFTNTELFEPLIQKLKSKVQIQLIIVNDSLNIRQDGLNFQRFIDNGGELFVCDPSQLMHHKYCIIDEKKIFSGSYNWTYFAEYKNFENVIVSEDTYLIKQYIQNFETVRLGAETIHKVDLCKPSFSLFSNDGVLKIEKKLSLYHSIKNIPSNIYKVTGFQPTIGSEHFQKYVTALDVSSSGNFLASAGGRWRIQIWDIETGLLYYHYEIEDKNLGSYPSVIKFSPNNKIVIMNDGKKGLVALAIEDKKLLYNRKYPEHVSEVTFNSVGTKIAVCSQRQVFILDTQTGEILEVIKTPFNFNRSLEFMNDDNNLLIASQGQGLSSHLKLYSFTQSKFVLDYKSTSKGIKSIRKIDEYSFIASGWTKDFHLWDIRNPIPKQVFRGHNNYIFSCDVDCEAGFAVSGSLDSKVNLWDIQTGDMLKAFEGHKTGVHAVKFDPNHSVIFSSDEDGKILTHIY